MTYIKLDDRMGVEKALKVFRRKVQRSGVLKDLRQNRYYVKPSEAKRLKQNAAERRRRKALRKARRRNR
jgi:small subunit ribosomal protein S21